MPKKRKPSVPYRHSDAFARGLAKVRAIGKKQTDGKPRSIAAFEIGYIFGFSDGIENKGPLLASQERKVTE